MPHSNDNKTNEQKGGDGSLIEDTTNVVAARSTSQSHLERDEEKRRDQGSTGIPPGTTSEGQQDATVNDPFYTIYTDTEKWTIVSIIAVAGLFSPLTSNIYLPAIPAISDAFHKSVELINLSVTVYMIFQGIAPMFWGTLSDYKGRRPVYMSCLLVLCLSCIGLALIPTSAYWLLMLLRCLQAFGSASTIAIGAGVIGDISRPEDRAGMFGVYSVGPTVGPAIAPVLGGVIADRLGWRAIFWFLVIASGVCFIFLFLLMPETLKALVGDGSYIPAKIYRPVIPIIGRGRRNSFSNCAKPPPKPFTNPLLLLKNPDIVLLLLVNGIATGIFYVISTSLSSLFTVTYPSLSVSDIGYCYLATGGSMAIGTVVAGKVLDKEYRKRKRNLLRAEGEDPDQQLDVRSKGGIPSSFPIEKARLGSTPYITLLFAAATVSYGWTVKTNISMAAPLILQMIIGFTTIWILTATQTLLIDLVPDRSSSVTACSNLIRCTTGAVMVSIVNPILNALGSGWTFVIFGGTGIIAFCLLIIVIKIGPRCRAKRKAEQSKKEEDKKKKEDEELEKRRGQDLDGKRKDEGDRP